MALVVGVWLWGVVTIGAHAMVAETLPSDGEHLPEYVIACPGAQRPEEGVGPAGSGERGAGRLREFRPHTTTSRQPGAELTEQAHRGDS